MNKYKNQYRLNEKIENLISPNEKIIWQGRPKKNAFILNRIITMMPFALLWLALDGLFIFAFFRFIIDQIPPVFIAFIVIFFLFHLAPVWIWVSRIVMAAREYKFTEYAVTDRRILVKSGVIAAGYTSFYYQEINAITIHIGLIDRLTKVGDIVISRNGTQTPAGGIIDIENPYEVYKIIEKVTREVASDIAYPNSYRPNGDEPK